MGNVLRVFRDDKVNNLKDILNSYGIDVDSIDLTSGCYIDKYDIRMSRGTRFSKVESVLIDIGLDLESYIPPIGYPVTSDGVYRIEVQKCPIQSVTFREIAGDCSRSASMYCPVYFGVTASMKRLVTDLNKIPNLVIGGIPGSGKSMLLHSIILSCIRSNADIYLCDPKMVEMSLYEGCPQTKALVYSADKLRGVISNIIERMHSRLMTLRRGGFRSVDENNSKYLSYTYKNGLAANISISYMKPIVLVIDEWADIFFQDNKIQNLLCLLAQKGRAAGISIVIATQRPSVKVLSGLVKASFPGRIAMRSASSIDSRVILERSGAELLKDPGTGLYFDSQTHSPIMFRAPFVPCVSSEIQNISEW